MTVSYTNDNHGRRSATNTVTENRINLIYLAISKVGSYLRNSLAGASLTMNTVQCHLPGKTKNIIQALKL
jgi:hypothetical protein